MIAPDNNTLPIDEPQSFSTPVKDTTVLPLSSPVVERSILNPGKDQGTAEEVISIRADNLFDIPIRKPVTEDTVQLSGEQIFGENANNGFFETGNVPQENRVLSGDEFKDRFPEEPADIIKSMDRYISELRLDEALKVTSSSQRQEMADNYLLVFKIMNNLRSQKISFIEDPEQRKDLEAQAYSVAEKAMMNLKRQNTLLYAPKKDIWEK